MTKAELSEIIKAAWTADPAAAGLAEPLADGMISALTEAVAEGILQAVGGGGTSGAVPWRTDLLAGTGTVFTLTYAPVNNSLMVYLNGLPTFDWTLSGKTLTLATARLAGDATLHARYQAIVPT